MVTEAVTEITMVMIWVKSVSCCDIDTSYDSVLPHVGLYTVTTSLSPFLSGIPEIAAGFIWLKIVAILSLSSRETAHSTIN